MSASDVVVAGMSGRFPLSDNTDELAGNLYAGTDMVTGDDTRWPTDLYGISPRMGKIVDFDRFDSTFFGIVERMRDEIDPQSRMLLEVVYEAIVDAGLNPGDLRGSRTGVYVGVSIYGMCDGYPDDIQPDSQKSMQGVMLQTMSNMKTFYASRISFVFDFRGPSMIVDTACSASGTALGLAMDAMELGRIDNAVVCGTHMTFEPYLVQMEQEMGICSPRGMSSVLDREADGFVKAEAVCCALLQRRSDARRIYATILTARMNIDGNKTATGMFFPSSDAQQELMVATYTEANIDPLELTYFEAHCTGTKVGDGPEIRAIYNAYCKAPGRTKPLPLGVMKSNVGHAEAGSGISSLIKVIIAYERACIPPNINMNNIRDECATYCPPLMPILEPYPYEPGLAAIDNFGIGGANAHILLEPNYKLGTSGDLNICDTIPRIVNICGRTEQSVKHIMDFIENNPKSVTKHFLALLGEPMKYTPNINSSGMMYRGSLIIKKVCDENDKIKYEYRKQIGVVKSKPLRPLWLLFPGLGGQWPAMARALMPIRVFVDKVEECHQNLQEFGVDLKHMLLSDDKTSMATMTAKFCTTTAIEIALYEVINSLGITVDGIIGHSFGEIACAYADGCLSTREAMVVTYFRGRVTEGDRKIPKGLMAVVGLSRSEAQQLCPIGVSIVCFNGKYSVVIAGPTNEMRKLIKTLEEQSIFVRQLESSEIPYHSPYMSSSARPMIDAIRPYIPEPKLRSRKWLSTSLSNANADDNPLLKLAGAEYFAHNLTHPVHFYEKLGELPADAVVLELGPHSVFGKIVTETLPNSSYVSLVKKDSNDTNMDRCMTGLATLYGLGFNIAIENLYPKVEWPVPRGTPSLSSLIKWDHSVPCHTKIYPDRWCRAKSADTTFTINNGIKEDMFFMDHMVDGNPIFPATGYLMLAWRKLAASLGKVWTTVPVVFEQVHLKRAVFLSDNSVTKLIIKYSQSSDEFSIYENDNLCVMGKIRSPGDDVLIAQTEIHSIDKSLSEAEYTLDRDDIYKELRILGLDYGPEFRRLRKVGTNNFRDIYGLNEWTGNFVTFMDAMLHSMILPVPYRKLMVPVIIRTVRIDPRVLFDAIKRNRVAENKPNNEPSNSPELGDFERDNPTHLVNFETEDSKESAGLINAISEGIRKHNERFALYHAPLPFYFDTVCRRLVAPGLEVDDVRTAPIGRRSDTADLTLDSYEFLPNDDMKAIDEGTFKQLTDYLEVCKYTAYRVLILVGKQIDNNFNCDKIDENVLQEYRNANNENHVLFRALDKIRGEIVDRKRNNNNNNIDINQTIDTIRDAYGNQLTRDLVNQCSRNERLIRSLVDIVCENFVTMNELKVTEINSTQAVFAKDVDRFVTQFRIKAFDVDYNLIVKSKQDAPEQFRESAVEWDVNNGVPLKQAHLIIIRDTPDLWHINLGNFVQDMYDTTEANGFLLMVFRYMFTEPEVIINTLFNQKPLNNNDLDLRQQKFASVLQNTGFRKIATKCDTIGTVAVLYRKPDAKQSEIPDNKNIVYITEGSYEQWFEILRDKVIAAKEPDNNCHNVWIIANDSSINGIIGLTNCLRLEPGGEGLRYIFHYDTNIGAKLDFRVRPYSDILANNLAANVIKGGKVGTYRHIKLPADYDKCVSNDYYLNTGQTRDLAGIQWFDARNIPIIKEWYDLVNNMVPKTRVEIYCSGVSFYDVMLATGRLPPKTEQIYSDCLLGFEYVGRRADTGERVMGVETGRTFATSINASFHNMTIVPEHWSMAEAATIINAYATLYYALIQRANLKQGESILIHSAAGGVGQAAINMCRHYGCDIYVTVGTVEKRRFLINEYNLPEARILNSRDILFKHQVMRLTEGRGVDIVLNSLAGEKLDISYQCVAKRGRIVEIGKYDMFHNRPVGMYDLLRDIQLIGVALDIVLMEDMEFFGQFAQWMHNNCANGCVKPINYTLFPATDADKAFRYMTTGKHIGKVVINIRDTEQPLIPAPSMTVSVKTFFDPNKSYIITGGLGGLGLELISWLQYYGARKFVVTSRGGLNTAYRKWMHARFRQVYERVKYFLSDWVVSTADGLTIGGARQLVSEAEGLAPIGGVFNLALVLNDSLLESQTCAKFRQSVDTKYRICANLDEITRRLDYRVDYFVVFSSVSCGKGNAGQSNYSYGNSMCERLCEGRRRDGHHGLAVQYGPVDDVGAYADAADHALTRMTTMRAQRVHSCFDVLDKLLAIKQPIVTSYKIVTQIKQSGSIKTRMVAELWRALGVDPDSTPDHITLGEIGLESIYAVEVQQEFQKQYNTHVTLNQIKSITIGMFKEYESGNITNIKKHLEAIKRARSVLLKQKFIMPSDKYTRLNALTTGHPVYFMPTILLNFSLIEELALKLNRPAIGLNWTREVSQLTTLKAVNKYYRNLLRHIEPTANYDVVGYLDSIILCTKLLRKGMANRAVILDTVTNWRFLEEQPTDASALEFMVNLIGDEWMPAAIRHRVVRQMRAESDVSAKIGVIVREVTEVTGSALVATDMDEIFRVMYARVRMLSEYGRATKLAKLKMSMAKGWAKMRSSKLTIIKPVLGDTTGEGVNDKSFVDLLLPESQTQNDDIRVERVNSKSGAIYSLDNELVDKILMVLK